MLHGYDSHRSTLGSIFSILLLMITVAFAIGKFDILINHRNPQITIWEYEKVIDSSFHFNLNDFEYRFAFGIMSNQFTYGDTANYNDPDYGTLRL